MDVSRNYYAPSDIMRTIDALSWNKFNRLHLHASDAQSWPLEIPALPELAEKGAYMAGLSYSPEVLRGIQEYGAYRGVEVIIEIETPGHASSVALAYPELIAAFNVQPDWSTYSAEPPTGQLKLNNTAVYNFLDTLWKDLLPRVSQYSSYFHTGGDEVNANVYLLDEGVRSNDSSVIRPLLQKFLDFNHDHVRAAGMTPIVWEEQLLMWNLTLGSDVVVQTWQSDDAVAQTVAKGHKALVGNYGYWVNTPLIRKLLHPSLTDKTPVPRLRQRPMARLLPRHLRPNPLSLRGLLHANPQLAPHLHLRPPLRRPRQLDRPRPRRRSPHLERADRSRELGRYGLAARVCGRGGAMERGKGRAWEE